MDLINCLGDRPYPLPDSLKEYLDEIKRRKENQEKEKEEKTEEIKLEENEGEEKKSEKKDVDEENRAGLFMTYKALCKVLSNNISAVNPDFPYTQTLASTLVEMANNNIYFAEHLPSLTDIRVKDGNLSEIKQMLEVFAFRMLGVEIPSA